MSSVAQGLTGLGVGLLCAVLGVLVERRQAARQGRPPRTAASQVREWRQPGVERHVAVRAAALAFGVVMGAVALYTILQMLLDDVPALGAGALMALGGASFGGAAAVLSLRTR